MFKNPEDLKQDINAMFDGIVQDAASGKLFLQRIFSEKGEYSSEYPTDSLVANLARNTGRAELKPIGGEIRELYVNPKKYDNNLSPFSVNLKFFPHKNGSIVDYEIPSAKRVTSYADGHDSIDDQSEAMKKVVVNILNE